ncbi:hypothetical protein KDK77_05105, partial [bacterium]|nr:hypothetical protein [bacterium]
MNRLLRFLIVQTCLFLFGLTGVLFLAGERVSAQEEPTVENTPPVVERIKLGSFFNSFTETLLINVYVSDDDQVSKVQLEILAHSDKWMNNPDIADAEIRATGDFINVTRTLDATFPKQINFNFFEPFILPEGLEDNEGIPADAYLIVRAKAIDTDDAESVVVEKRIEQDLIDFIQGISLSKYYNPQEDEDYIVGGILFSDVERIQGFTMDLFGVSRAILEAKGGIWNNLHNDAFVFQSRTFLVRDNILEYKLLFELDENFDIPADAILNSQVYITDMAGNTMYASFLEFLGNSIEEDLLSMRIEPSSILLTGFAESFQVSVIGTFSESGDLDITSSFKGTGYIIVQDENNPSVSVSPDGVLTAIANGTVQLTALNRDQSDTVSVTVDLQRGLEGVELGPEGFVIPYLGAREKLRLKGFVRDLDNDIMELDLTNAVLHASYFSSDTSTIIVDEDGYVTSLVVGQAEITVDLQGKQDTLLVEAVDGPPQIDVIPESLRVPEGEIVKIVADTFDDLGVVDVLFFVDGFPIGNVTTEPFEMVLQAPERRAGSKLLLTARATDTIGQQTFSEVVELLVIPPIKSRLPKLFGYYTPAEVKQITTTTPDIGVIAPQPGERIIVSTPWIFRVTGDDSIISRVEFFVNGIQVGTAHLPGKMPVRPIDTTAGAGRGARGRQEPEEPVIIPVWQMQYDASQLDPGRTVVVTMRAYDNRGFASNSEAILVRATADLPPTLRLLTPIDGGEVIENTNLHISGRYTDDTFKRGHTVRFFINDEMVYEKSAKEEEFVDILFDPSAFADTRIFNYSHFVPTGNVFTKLKIRMEGEDTVGQIKNTNSNTIIILANLPPDVVVSNPIPGSELTTGDTVNIKAVAIDDSGVISTVEFFIDGELIGADESSTPSVYGLPEYSVAWYVPLERVEDVISITARATDGTGKKTFSTETIVAIVADHTLPTIHIASPNDDEVFRDTQNALISVAGFDDIGVKHVSITISKDNNDAVEPIVYETDNVVIVNKLLNTFFVNYVLDKSYLEVGDRIKIEATATDNSNNTNFAPPLRIDVVEDTPPQVTIIRPFPNQPVTMDKFIKVDAAVVDDIGLNRVELLDNDNNVLQTDHLAPFQFDFYVGTFSQETAIGLKVRAYDTALQEGEAQVDILAVFDKEPPFVSVLEPYAEGFVPVGRSVDVIAGTADNVAVDRVRFVVTYHDNDTDTFTDTSGTLDSAGVFTRFQNPYTFRMGYEDTQASITATAWDTSNNSSTTKIYVKLIKDRPPVIGINAPSAGATYWEGDDLEMKFTVTDDYGVALVRSISGGEVFQSKNLPLSTDWKKIYKELKIDKPEKITLQTRAPLVDLHYNAQGQPIDVSSPLYVEAVDAYGNVGSTVVTINVKNDINPPTAHITKPKGEVTVLENTTVNFSVETTDDIAIKGIKLYMNGTQVAFNETVVETRVDILQIPNPLSFGFLEVSRTTVSTFKISHKVPAGTVNSSLMYHVKSYDRAGNHSEESNKIYVKVIPDETPPNISIAKPETNKEIVERQEYYIV